MRTIFVSVSLSVYEGEKIMRNYRREPVLPYLPTAAEIRLRGGVVDIRSDTEFSFETLLLRRLLEVS